MNNRLEMGVNKCRHILSNGVMGRNNGGTRSVVFLDFGEEVENRGAGIEDMKDRGYPW